MDPASTFFKAYFRRSGEDRLTEVFAKTLASVPELCNLLAAQAGLARVPFHRVETQMTYGANKIDLKVTGLDRHSQMAWVLWSEHKKDSPFSRGQLPRYRLALDAEEPGTDRALIAITRQRLRNEEASEAESARAVSLTWAQVLALSHKAGAEIGGASWRHDQAIARADARMWALAEWIDFIAH